MLYASMMPEQELLEELAEAITAHKLVPSENTKNKLLLHCMIIMTKFKIDMQDGGNVLKTMEQWKKHSKWMDLMKENNG